MTRDFIGREVPPTAWYQFNGTFERKLNSYKAIARIYPQLRYQENGTTAVAPPIEVPRLGTRGAVVLRANQEGQPISCVPRPA